MEKVSRTIHEQKKASPAGLPAPHPTPWPLWALLRLPTSAHHRMPFTLFFDRLV